VTDKSGPHGILAIWHDMVADHEQAVNNWYNHEHHSERLGIPGFHSARRHRALAGEPGYFVFYETDDPSVLESRAYLDRVDNPSPLTRLMMPHYRHTSRLVCERAQRFGDGHGGFVQTMRCVGEDFAGPAAAQGLAARAEAALAEPGIVSVEIWNLDPLRTGVPTKEKKIRGEPDQMADGVIMVSGNDAAQVTAAGQKHFDPAALQTDRLVQGPPDSGLYQLIFTMGG